MVENCLHEEINLSLLVPHDFKSGRVLHNWKDATSPIINPAFYSIEILNLARQKNTSPGRRHLKVYKFTPNRL